MDELNNAAESGIPAADGAGSPSGDEQVNAQLARIRTMDPEMRDLGAILRSNAGESFRRYVGMGLDFVEAYTLAAKDRLEGLHARKAEETARAKAAAKDHLAATTSRGRGALSVPAGEMAIIRALLPDATDEEIRHYYNQDRKRFKR